MLDFISISTRNIKGGITEIYPKFIIKRSSDLMIRGGDFYAIWLEDRGLWSTDEDDLIQLIDRDLAVFAKDFRSKYDGSANVLYMRDAESGMIDAWHKYCQKQMSLRCISTRARSSGRPSVRAAQVVRTSTKWSRVCACVTTGRTLTPARCKRY